MGFDPPDVEHIVLTFVVSHMETLAQIAGRLGRSGKKNVKPKFTFLVWEGCAEKAPEEVKEFWKSDTICLQKKLGLILDNSRVEACARYCSVCVAEGSVRVETETRSVIKEGEREDDREYDMTKREDTAHFLSKRFEKLKAELEAELKG